MEAFLASGKVRFGADLYVPLDVLKDALKASAQCKNYTDHAFRQPFEEHNLRIERTQLPYRGRTVSRNFVLGCDLAGEKPSGWWWQTEELKDRCTHPKTLKQLIADVPEEHRGPLEEILPKLEFAMHSIHKYEFQAAARALIL